MRPYQSLIFGPRNVIVNALRKPYFQTSLIHASQNPRQIEKEDLWKLASPDPNETPAPTTAAPVILRHKDPRRIYLDPGDKREYRAADWKRRPRVTVLPDDDHDRLEHEPSGLYFIVKHDSVDPLQSSAICSETLLRDRLTRKMRSVGREAIAFSLASLKDAPPPIMRERITLDRSSELPALDDGWTVEGEMDQNPFVRNKQMGLEFGIRFDTSTLARAVEGTPAAALVNFKKELVHQEEFRAADQEFLKTFKEYEREKGTEALHKSPDYQKYMRDYKPLFDPPYDPFNPFEDITATLSSCRMVERPDVETVKTAGRTAIATYMDRLGLWPPKEITDSTTT